MLDLFRSTLIIGFSILGFLGLGVAFGIVVILIIKMKEWDKDYLDLIIVGILGVLLYGSLCAGIPWLFVYFIAR